MLLASNTALLSFHVYSEATVNVNLNPSMEGNDGGSVKGALNLKSGLVVNLTAQSWAPVTPKPKLQTSIAKQVGSGTWVLRTRSPWIWTD